MQKRRDNLSVSLFPVKGPSLACNSAPKRKISFGNGCKENEKENFII